MPRPSTPGSRQDPTRPWDGVDRHFDKAFAPPVVPNITGLSFPTSLPDRPMAPEPFSTPQGSSEGSEGPVTPTEYESLDRLWDSLRHQKELKMAKQPAKVKSLEGTDLPELSPPKPIIKKRKSHCTFRESVDGRTVTATFDLPGIKKQDVHISFQRNRLVITWETSTVTEREEDGRLVRERKEHKYSRTIPIPEGTKFEEVRAAMDGRHLILTYPNMRTIRAEGRPKTPMQQT